MSNTPRIAIAAGGTGGHIYPALATARSIERRHPGAIFIYFCGNREVELGVYQRNGIAPCVLPIGSAGTGVAGKLRLAYQLIRAGGVANSTLREFQPQALLSLGGYTSYPVARAAHRLRVPIILYEPNRVLGRAQRLCLKWADRIACGYPELAAEIEHPPAVWTGLPVRPEFGRGDRAAGREFFGVPQDARCVLVTGGSQGALSLNRVVWECIPQLEVWAERRQTPLQLLWSCGERFFAERDLQEINFERGFFRCAAFAFIEKMELAYAAADLVLSRAGAGAVAECAASDRPAIYLPLAAATADHQRLNAEAVACNGGAVVLMERGLSAAGLTAELIALLEQPEKLARMAAAAAARAQPDAADKLAEAVLELIVVS